MRVTKTSPKYLDNQCRSMCHRDRSPNSEPARSRVRACRSLSNVRCLSTSSAPHCMRPSRPRRHCTGESSMSSKAKAQSTQPYTEQASTLIARYESISFEDSHRDELHVLPTTPGRVLDIGAGSGRDAAWLAERGHSVLAVEPTAPMRAAAMQLHPSSAIEWLDDALPDLTVVHSRGERFDLILISAVWMHLDEDERAAAMPRVASLLSLNGVLLLSLRHGPIPVGRRIFDVSGNETIALAAQCGLGLVLNVEAKSVQTTNLVAGVTWTKLGFKAGSEGDRAGSETRSVLG